MLVRGVPVGMPFRFMDESKIFIALGGGWYCTPEGYDGGPWTDSSKRVEEVATKLHSHSFDGIDDRDTLRIYWEKVEGESFPEGDMAILRHEMTKRGLTRPTVSSGMVVKKTVDETYP